VTLFKFFRETHKWTGIVLAVVFIEMGATGFLLLQKKRFDWIQPPTRTGAPGDVATLITLPEVLAVVLEQGHPDFRDVGDIDRIDFRPAARVHRVHSRHNHSELQVDAVTGEVLSLAPRRSDWLEDLHDGSLLGDWAHAVLLPLTAVILVFLSVSGLYLWLQPIYRRSQPTRPGAKNGRQARRG
jgi:uncharacterized iron-regulated membrane protein